MKAKQFGYGLSAVTMTAASLLNVAVAGAIAPSSATWTGAPGVYDADAKTYTLDRDSKEGTGLDLEIGAGEEYVLDLKDFTLVNYCLGCSTISIAKGGKLTIKDSGTDATKGIVTQLAGSTAATIYNEGTLVIESGTFSQASSAERPVIDNKGEVVITGGEFIGINTTTGKYTPVINNEGGKVTISDAVVTQNGPYYAVQTIIGGETTIKSGTFKSTVTEGAAAVIGNLPGEKANSTITISGGTFSMPTTTQLVVADYAGNTTTISGGTFSGAIYSGNDRTVITGGTFTGAFSSHETEAGKVAGGTFGIDPTKHLADGYVALKDGDTYGVYEQVKTVVKDDANEADSDAEGANEELLGDIADEVLGALYENYATLEEGEITLDSGVVIKITDANAAKTALKNGETLTVELLVADATLTEADSTKVETAMSEGAKAWKSYDYSLHLDATSGLIGEVTELADEMVIELDVSGAPKLADGYERAWEIVHLHGATPEVIKANEKDGVLTFTASKFSTFTVTYVDTEKAAEEAEAETPDTGLFTAESGSKVAGAVVAAIAVAAVVMGFTAVKLNKR